MQDTNKKENRECCEKCKGLSSPSGVFHLMNPCPCHQKSEKEECKHMSDCVGGLHGFHCKCPEPYNKRDHSHCFEEKKPPCGQRIEHLKCCICEKLNPIIKAFITQERKAVKEELVEKVKNMKFVFTKRESVGVKTAKQNQNHALDKVLQALKEDE